MSILHTITPGFRGSCLIVCILNVTFFFMMLSQGIMQSMAEFKVPESTLNSPHYADAMFWVFLHMAVIGIVIGLLGISVDAVPKQRIISVVLALLFCVYAFLDLKTSDNPFGSALYKGPRSVFPVFVDILYIVLFVRLAIFLRKKKMYV